MSNKILIIMAVIGMMLIVSSFINFSNFFAIPYQDIGTLSPEEHTFSNEICLDSSSTKIDDLKITYEIYGPKASSFPCKDEVVRSGSKSFDKSAEPGECTEVEYGIDLSGLEGENFHLVFHVYDGDELVEDITGTGEDYTGVSQCESMYEDKLKEHNCQTDPETGHYLFCQGMAHVFNIGEEDNIIIEEDSEELTDIDTSGEEGDILETGIDTGSVNKSYIYLGALLIAPIAVSWFLEEKI